MTVTPLFLDDLAQIQKALRLSALREDSDAVAILEQGVRAARVRFYQRLGSSTIATILETVYTEQPETEDEMRRSVGNLCEVELVRLQLLDRLPVLFMDASGSAREAFSSEGAFRSMDPVALIAIRARIEAQIENWLAFMAGEVSLGDDELTQAYTQKPVDPKPILGASPFLTADGTEPFTANPGVFDGNFIEGEGSA